MSEQAGPDLGVEQPAVAGPEGTPGTAEQAATQAEVDWQQRYQNLQPEYTRATQRVAELESQQELYDLLVSTDDPDTRRQIAEQLGYVLEDAGQTFDGEQDPFSQYEERLTRIEQSMTARQQSEQQAEHAAEVRAAVDQQLDQLGIDKDDQDWVLAYAINALPPTQEGLPDVAQAHQVFVERETARQRDWAKTKRAPHVAPNGQAATEVPNLDNRQERWEYMARRLNENEQVS